MTPDTRSESQNNLERRRTSNKEDAKHALEKLCDFDPDETVHKMFSR